MNSVASSPSVSAAERVYEVNRNEGNGYADSIEQARKETARGRAYEAAVRLRDNRPSVADPAAYLSPFVDFLKREGKDPQQFILDAMGKHRVVIGMWTT